MENGDYHSNITTPIKTNYLASCLLSFLQHADLEFMNKGSSRLIFKKFFIEHIASWLDHKHQYIVATHTCYKANSRGVTYNQNSIMRIEMNLKKYTCTTTTKHVDLFF